MEFVEPEDEPGHFRNPLPPDDRLWRHPSELGTGPPLGGPPAGPGHLTGGPAGGGLAGGGTGGPVGDDDRPSMWLVAAVSAVSAGLLASGLAMVVVGLMGTNEQLRPVVERQMEPRPIDAVTTGDVVDVADRARAAVAQLRVEGTAGVVGSGVIFRSDGHLLTNASVVGDAKSLRVTLDDGRELPGRVVGSDPDTDIAVVKIDGEGAFPTAVLGTASDVRVGQQAIAIGCPVELAGGPSVTVGVISGLHRSVRGSDGRVLHDLVQTDARVPAGWPGGALLDSSGSVVGITTSVGSTVTPAGTGNGFGGFGFAVPIDLARTVAEQLMTSGRATGVWLGVQGTELDWMAAANLGISGGVQVGEVKRGSPAERGGLSVTDVIVAVDGTAVTTMGQLVIALRRHSPGDTLRLDVLREEQPMSMVVVLTERPAQA
jgi:S1-C subfamily serine protease